MPTLINVQYTHGNNEKGADFILTKISEELGDTEHIGVIVKRGKITQSHSDVTEQIEECVLRRLSSNGKKEIFLSEIWIVSNNTISVNAQEKIFNNYKTQKIKFVDINSLYRLTEKYFPDYGIEIDINSLNYLNSQKEHTSVRVTSTSLILLDKDTYIEQDLIKIDNNINAKEESINLFDEINKSKVIFIEAQMGGGKSRLVNKVIEHYTSLEQFKNHKKIPIYLDAKIFLKNEQSLEETIEDIIEANNLEIKNISSYVIIIDGLDEVKEDSIEKIINLATEAEAKSNINLIITTRLISDAKLETIIESRWQKYSIKPLSLDKILSFLKLTCTSLNIKDRLFEDLKKSELFKVLPKTPISAIILAKLLTEGHRELPSNITELFAQYCELSLGRWDIDKGLKTLKQYDALDKIVSRISKYIIDNSLPALSIGETLDIFEEYLKDRNLQIDPNELFEDLMKRSDIMTYGANDTIMFKHRSFAEFFYAKYLESQIDIEISPKVFHPYWSNIYFFYIGLKRDCPELLKNISQLPIEHEGHKLSKMMNMGSFLLAGYQTPYKVITESINSIFLEYGSYYDDVISGNEESILVSLPPMYIMALFRHWLSENYSYQFFSPAILNCIEDLATSPSIKSNGEAYALLFLDIARDDIGEYEPFHKLLENHDNLPMPIQLAIAGASKTGKYEFAAIKKFEKKVRKRARTSKVLRDYINDLYTKSVDNSYDLTSKLPKTTRKLK